MAEQRNNTAEQDSGTPFTRPGFVVAAVLVVVVVLLGVIAAVRIGRSDDAAAPPTASTTAVATPPATGVPADPSASVCGLAGAGQGPMTAAPTVAWEYQGTTAYPTSPQFGPGRAAPEGYRFCFQHTPEGAAVMAANALAQGSDPEVGARWAAYALGEGRYRDQLLTEIGTVTGAPDTRIKIAGVRLLSYDATSARVDLATRVSSQNQNLVLSAVYELVWQAGDWKISTDVQRPLDTATIPDLNGYLPWGE